MKSHPGLKPRILVTAATGRIGSAVTRQLLERGYPVTALVPRADSRSDALGRAGATIAVGDLNEPDDLRHVMHGVQRAYFAAPWIPTQLHAAMNFAVAAQDAKLETVTAVSQWLAQPNHPAVATRQSYLSDRVFDWMPSVDTVTVNTGWFADNYMGVLPTIAQLGIFPFRLGSASAAPVSNEDIARVAVGALANPAPHVGKYYRPTGPELLDPEQLTAIFERVLDRPVKYQEMSERMFFKAVKALGLAPLHQMAQLRHYIEDYRRGGFAAGGVTDVVREVGGSEPENFETIVRRYVGSNPMARPSLAGKLRVVGALLRILLTTAPDLPAYEAAKSQPLLRAPDLALENAAWRETHAVAGAFGTTSVFNAAHIRLPSRPGGRLAARDWTGGLVGNEGEELRSVPASSSATVA